MDLKKFVEVYEFARKAHEGQFRKTGEPYIAHPLEVAKIAQSYGADEQAIFASLLHDVVEDCNIGLNEIETRFGKEISFLVDGVTKCGDGKLTFEKVREYSGKDRRVMMVKLADRIHNTSTLFGPKLADTREKYKRTNLQYIDMGRELGFEEMAFRLEFLTKELT